MAHLFVDNHCSREVCLEIYIYVYTHIHYVYVCMCTLYFIKARNELPKFHNVFVLAVEVLVPYLSFIFKNSWIPNSVFGF